MKSDYEKQEELMMRIALVVVIAIPAFAAILHLAYIYLKKP